jgi:hypothetical protein
MPVSFLQALAVERILQFKLTAMSADVMSVDVCCWHKADMLNALTNVRYWGQSGH